MIDKVTTDDSSIDSAASALSAGLGVLLPCPFCGKAETAELVDSDTFQDLMPWEVEPEGHMVWWAVMCDASKPGGRGGCGASGGFAETEDDAIKRWNTRTPNDKAQGAGGSFIAGGSPGAAGSAAG